MKSSKEKRIQKEEIHDKMFTVPKSPSDRAKRFFEMPAYSHTSLCAKKESN